MFIPQQKIKQRICPVIIGLFLMFQPQLLFTQGDSKWLKKGAVELHKKQYSKALEYYEWANRSGNLWQASYGMAKCYKAMGNNKKASLYFGKVALAEDAPKETFFHLGHCLLTEGYPDSAATFFEKYIHLSPEHSWAKEFLELKSLENLPPFRPVEIVEFQFNTKYSEYSAVIRDSALYFSSSRKPKSGIVHTNTATNSTLSDLYIVENFLASTKSKLKVKAVSSVNSLFFEGSASFSGDGQYMYLTRNISPKGQGSYKGNLGVFRSEWADGIWTNPQSLNLNNSGYSTAQPSINKDNSLLYFVSDMPGGYGGTDIYSVKLHNGIPGTPENLGPEINTPADEGFPFIHEDGTLFFSSEGHLGYGGLDLFKCNPVQGKWTRPQNLGKPFNSIQDDFSFFQATGDQGFLSSNRNTGSKDDIFLIQFLAPEFACRQQQKNSYCYEFTDESGLSGLEYDEPALVYEWSFGDGKSAFGLTTTHCYSRPGDYLVELNLRDTIQDFVFVNEVTYQLEIRDIEQVFIQTENKIYATLLTHFDGSLSKIPAPFEISKYQWQIGGVFSQGKKTTHIFEYPGDYEIELGIIAIDPKSGEKINLCSSIIVTVK